MNFKLVLLFIILLASFNSKAQVVIEESTTEVTELSVKDELLNTFCTYLKGEYNSQTQSETDTSYFNISLIMLPIWENRSDARYFYVEQAMVGKESKPYRQRVYKIYQSSPTTIVSAIYELKSPDEFVKLHESKKKQNQLKEDDVIYKEGCDVFLEYNNGVFEGGTQGKDCSSKLRGAKYTVTDVKVMDGKIISWDRGYTENGIHAWGAVKGGYIFEKIK